MYLSISQFNGIIYINHKAFYLSSERAIFTQIAFHTTGPIRIFNRLQQKVFYPTKDSTIKFPLLKGPCTNVKINQGHFPSSGTTPTNKSNKIKKR